MKIDINQNAECKGYVNSEKVYRIGNSLLLLLIFTAAVVFLAYQGVYAMSFTAFTKSPDTDTQVRLDWSSVPGARMYQLLRIDDSDNVTTLPAIDVNTSLDPLTYTDTGLEPGKTYTYTIQAYSDAGCTIKLDEKTVPVSTTKIIRPYNVFAVYDINAKTVSLTWDSSSLATGSIINKTTNGVKSSTPTVDTTYAAVSVNGLSLLQFTIQSTGTGGLLSLESNTVTVNPIDPPIISASSSMGNITVTWPAFSQIGSFRLERSKWNGASWDAWTTVNSSLSGQSVIDTPTAAGQYRYRLCAKDGSAYTGYSNISGAISSLMGPTGLHISIVDLHTISLAWTNGAGNQTPIQVQRRLADGSYTAVATLANTAEAYNDTTVSVTSGAVYTYRVRSYESASNYSAAAEASITANLPNAPARLYANVVSTSALTLNWVDQANNETGFRIERLTNTGTFTEIDTVAANTTSYTDNTVAAGNMYIYRIRPYNVLGNSSYSNEVTVTEWDAVAPASLTVKPASAASLELNWSYTGSASYNTIIERKIGTVGTWVPIYTTAQGVLRYIDSGLLPNTRYFYRVRKSLGTSATGVSYPNNDTGIGAYTYLGEISLSGSAAAGNRIYLTWTGSTGSSDVIIERKMANGGFSALTTLSSSTTGWYDNTGLIPGASYTYRIKAFNSSNESLYSNELTVANIYIDAPSNLTVAIGNNSAIELKWKDNSTDETGFEIWRSAYGAANYILYSTVDRNIDTYTDNAVQTGVQYSYMVRAYAVSGNLCSPYSNSASIGIGLVSPPANLNYRFLESNKVLLSWADTSNNESGFKVEYKIGKEGEWNIYSWLTPNTTTYTAIGINPRTVYGFRIRAYLTASNSDSLSNEITFSTAIPAAPADAAARSLSSSRVKITWKDKSDCEKGYRILRKQEGAYYFATVAELKEDSTEFTDSNLISGTNYIYKVVSFNDSGSAESNEAAARTNVLITFTDLTNVSWAREAIENLAGMGITFGAAGTQYNPDSKVTRAEFTAMIVRAFKFDTTPVGSLADVKLNKWYYREIMIAENYGIISGDSKNKFYPNASITREEMAIILFKAMEAAGKEYTGHDNSVLEGYSDKNMISPNSIASMAILIGEGIIDELPGNILGPRSTVTRAQAAVYLYRAMNE